MPTLDYLAGVLDSKAHLRCDARRARARRAIVRVTDKDRAFLGMLQHAFGGRVGECGSGFRWEIAGGPAAAMLVEMIPSMLRRGSIFSTALSAGVSSASIDPTARPVTTPAGAR